MNKKLFIFLSFLLLIAATLHPASENSNAWIVEKAEEGFSEAAANPVIIHPLQLPAIELKGPRQAMPPRMPLEAEGRKAQFFQRSLPQPTFIPQHSVQQDPSTKESFQILAPSRLKTFKGLSETLFFPADPVIAAGPTHVVIATNSALGIYNKKGHQIVKASFFSWFHNVTEVNNASMFDPKILYDQEAGHFIFLVDALRDSDKSAWLLLSVSKTSDATGEWVSWALNMKLNGRKKVNTWADFPGLGFDETAIYMTANMFSFSSDNFAYAKLRIVKKDEVYAFGDVHWFDRWNLKDATGQKAATVQPAQSFGPSPVEYLLSCQPEQGNKVTLWYVPNPTAARPSLKKKGIPVSSFVQPPDADQKGSGTLINDGGSDFRNVVAANGSIYTAQSLSHNWGSGPVSAIRVYQFSEDGTVQHEIEFGADKLHYYYPSIAVDSRGNIVVVFNRSGSGEFVGVHFTGRKANATTEELQPSKALKISDHSYVSLDTFSRNRWGDYTGIALDDNDSVWIYGELVKDEDSWTTQVGRVKYH